jgi:hypothetical protein
MRLVPHRAWAAFALLLVTALPAAAATPVPVTIGRSRDGVLHDLQRVVDRYYGPGRIDVRTGFVGAHAGDPDPWMWTTVPGKMVVLTLLEKKSPHGTVGWYTESGGIPLLDGIGDGVVLDRARLKSSPTALRLPNTVQRFGIYVARESGGKALDGDDESYLYFSNRMLNDGGAQALPPLHAPWDGNVQMLVYDLGRLVAPDTWLVACEYSNSAHAIGTGDGQSDNDYSDLVFTVTGVGVTPTLATSFGRLKALYR